MSEIKRILKKSKQILVSDGPKALLIGIFSKVRGRLLANRLNHGQLTVREVLSNKFSNIQPLQFMKVDRSEYRLNIVTDSLRGDSLLGGVATALILAVQYCNKENIPLRIITRTAETNPLDFDNFLKMMELKKPIGVEYYTDYDRYLKRNHHKLEVSEKDIFIATSWWSAHNIQSINLRKHFFYILQEVEPLFYPNSDEQLLCEEVLNNRDIKFIINSKLLYDYYENNNYVNVAKNGVYFEPAFIKKLYSASEASFKEKEKFNLFFYSRPKNPRNLFYRGLDIIDEALAKGILDENWNIFFVGSDVPLVTFPNGTQPKFLGQISWFEYSSFLKTVDLGLCLMHTPHPSYPPLDVVSSGGVVLTNTYRNKKELYYSKNIICRDLEKKSF